MTASYRPHCPDCGAELNRSMLFFTVNGVKVLCSACWVRTKMGDAAQEIAAHKHESHQRIKP